MLILIQIDSSAVAKMIAERSDQEQAEAARLAKERSLRFKTDPLSDEAQAAILDKMRSDGETCDRFENINGLIVKTDTDGIRQVIRDDSNLRIQPVHV